MKDNSIVHFVRFEQKKCNLTGKPAESRRKKFDLFTFCFEQENAESMFALAELWQAINMVV